MKATVVLSPLLIGCLAVACGAVDAATSKESVPSQLTPLEKRDSGERGLPDDVAEDSPAATSTDDCGALTRTACMESKACTLTLAPGTARRSGAYLCRAAVGTCEENLAQADLTKGSSAAEAAESKKLCADRPGCAFQVNDCYCRCRGTGRTAVDDGPEADPCRCYCAGGAPTACVAIP